MPPTRKINTVLLLYNPTPHPWFPLASVTNTWMALLEKPHWGNILLPFMNSITLLSFTRPSIVPLLSTPSINNEMPSRIGGEG